jgi:hypothetical protein
MINDESVPSTRVYRESVDGQVDSRCEERRRTAKPCQKAKTGRREEEEEGRIGGADWGWSRIYANERRSE